MRGALPAALLIAAGAYILVQPFDRSPWSCLDQWLGAGLDVTAAVANCTFNAPAEGIAAFLIPVGLALVMFVAASRALPRGRRR